MENQNLDMIQHVENSYTEYLEPEFVLSMDGENETSWSYELKNSDSHFSKEYNEYINNKMEQDEVDFGIQTSDGLDYG